MVEPLGTPGLPDPPPAPAQQDGPDEFAWSRELWKATRRLMIDEGLRPDQAAPRAWPGVLDQFKAQYPAEEFPYRLGPFASPYAQTLPGGARTPDGGLWLLASRVEGERSNYDEEDRIDSRILRQIVASYHPQLRTAAVLESDGLWKAHWSYADPVGTIRGCVTDGPHLWILVDPLGDSLKDSVARGTVDMSIAWSTFRDCTPPGEYLVHLAFLKGRELPGVPALPKVPEQAQTADDPAGRDGQIQIHTRVFQPGIRSKTMKGAGAKDPERQPGDPAREAGDPPAGDRGVAPPPKKEADPPARTEDTNPPANGGDRSEGAQDSPMTEAQARQILNDLAALRSENAALQGRLDARDAGDAQVSVTREVQALAAGPKPRLRAGDVDQWVKHICSLPADAREAALNLIRGLPVLADTELGAPTRVATGLTSGGLAVPGHLTDGNGRSTPDQVRAAEAAAAARGEDGKFDPGKFLQLLSKGGE